MKLTKKSYYLLLIDYLSAVLAWVLFFYFRKTHIEFTSFIRDQQFYLGVIVVPLFWILIYWCIYIVVCDEKKLWLLLRIFVELVNFAAGRI